MRSPKRPFVRKYHEKAVVDTRVCGTCCVATTLATLAGFCHCYAIAKAAERESDDDGGDDDDDDDDILTVLTTDARLSVIRERMMREVTNRGIDPLPLPSRSVIFF